MSNDTIGPMNALLLRKGAAPAAVLDTFDVADALLLPADEPPVPPKAATAIPAPASTAVAAADGASATLIGVTYGWKTHVELAGVTVTATSAAVPSGVSAQTAAAGPYALPGLPASTYTITASLNTLAIGRAITAASALAALRIAAGLNPNATVTTANGTAQTPLSAYQLIAADVNGDGRVTGADALAILRMASGQANALTPKFEFVAQTQQFYDPTSHAITIDNRSVPTSFATVQPITADSALNFVAVLTGDVLGRYAPLDGQGVLIANPPTLGADYFAALSAGTGTPLSAYGIAAPLAITAALQVDTGVSATDGVTSNDAVRGKVTAGVGVAGLRAGLDGVTAALGTDISDALDAQGTFALSAARIDALSGGVLPDGVHTLHLAVTDANGSVTRQDVTFTLLTALATPAIALASSDRAGSAADQAAVGRVTIVGTATPGAAVQLTGSGNSLSTTAAADGHYAIADVSLTAGANAITVNATDRAGNTGGNSTTITRLAGSGGSDVVLTWDAIVRAAITRDADAPTVGSRTLAIESLAVYDTLAAINGTSGYAVGMKAPAGADVNAALAAAADAVLDQLYPSQAPVFDAALAEQLAAIPDSQAKADGVALGRAIAAKELALRANDGSTTNTTDYGSDAVGKWRPTPYAYASATTPQWANLTPFGLQASNQFRAPPPPALTSAAYAAALAQVASLGKSDSTTRTADQTASAKFWNGQTGTDTPVGQWNSIAATVAQSAGNSVSQNARLFALLNVSLADATISAWNNKFFYDLWRPVTAIRSAAQDGNPADAAVADPTWLPLLSTPAFPDYVEGHGTLSGAASAVLGSVFGDATAFTVTSQSTPGVTRSFTSFSAAASDAAESRIYGGIHFQFSADAGLALGAQVGAYDVTQFSLGTAAPPLVQLNAALPAITRTDPVVSGQVIGKFGVSSLTASLDGAAFAPVALGADGSFSIQPTLALDGSADGLHRFVFRATDPTGLLSGPVNYSFTLVTQPATITLGANSLQSGGVLVPGSALVGTVAVLSGDTIGAASYTIDGGVAHSVGVDAGGAFNQMLDVSRLAAGAHSVVLSVTDGAGIIITDTLSVTSALAPFRLTGVFPINGATDQGVTYRPQISFSRPVDPTTVTAASFYATDSQGAVLPANIVVQADGSSAKLLFTGPIAGASTITLHIQGMLIQAAGDGAKLDAAGTGVPSDVRPHYTTVSTTAVPGTTLSGIVVDPGPDGVPLSPDDLASSPQGTADWAHDTWKLPIAGARVYILGRESEAVFTDAAGRYTLTNVPAGDVKLVIDGRTATNAPAGYFFPELVSDITVQPGAANTAAAGMGSTAERAANVGNPSLYLPRVASDAMTTLSTTAVTTVTAPQDSSLGAGTFTLTPAQLAQIQLKVAPGSVVDKNGVVVANATVGISAVPPALVQDMLPPGILQHSFDITIQAGQGALFNQDAVLTLPNVFGLKPGEQTYLLGFNHTTGRLEVEGTATASADGQTVTSDPGAGVTQPGWHAATPKLTKAKGGVNAPCPPDNGDVGNAQLDYAQATGNVASDGASLLGGVDGLFGVFGANNVVFTGVAAPVAAAGGFIADANTAVTNLKQNVNDAVHDGFFSWSTAILFTQGLSDSLNCSLDVIAGAGNYLGPGGKAAAGIAGLTRATTALISLGTSDAQAMEDAGNRLDAAHAANPCPPGTSPDLATPPAAPLKGNVAADLAALKALQPYYDAISADAAVLAPLGTLDYTRDDLGITAAQDAALAASAPALLAALADMVAQLTAITKMPTVTQVLADIVAAGSAHSADVMKASSVSLTQYVTALNNAELEEFSYAHACDNVRPGEVCAPDPRLLIDAKLQRAISNAGFASAIGTLDTTLYAALQSPDGNIQRFTFNYRDGIEYFLAPNTLYTLTVYDPVVNKTGEVTFISSASGKDTVIPDVTLFNDTGTARANGLSTRASFIVGLDPAKASNLVDGQNDLAVLKTEGAAATLALKTGVVASINLPGTVQAVALQGSTSNPNQLTAFVALGAAGLAVVDVSKSLKPVLLATVATGGNAVDVAADDTTGLVAVATGSALQIVSAGAMPMVIGTVKIAATRVLAVDGLAYAAVGSTLDVVDLQAGTVQQKLLLGGTITGFAREGRYLYAVAGNSLQVLDLSGSTLVRVGSVGLPVGGNRLSVGNGIAYVGNANGTFTGGFATVNVTDPTNPVLVEGVDDNTIAGASIALAGPGTGLSVQSFSIGGSPVGQVDVINTANPADTSQRITRYTLTGQQAYDVKIGNGVGFVAAGNALDVVNYIAGDKTGIAPKVTITQGPVDVDPATAGIQVYEGGAITLGINATDNVQVRNSELLVNGVVDENAVSYPFSLGVILPTIAGNGGSAVTLQVRTYDTGGNTALSAPITVQLVADTRPLVLQGQSVLNGAHLGLSLRSINFSFNRALAATVAAAMPVTITAPDGTMVMTGTQLRGGGKLLEVDFTPLMLGAYTVKLDGTKVHDSSGAASAPSETFGFTVQTFSKTFLNVDGGDWNVGSNWTGGSPPGATDSVLIDDSVTGPVTFAAGTSTVASLSMDATATLNVTGGSLTFTGASELAQVNLSSATLVGGTVLGTLTELDRGGLLDGVAIAGNGTVVVTNNNALTVKNTIANAGLINLASQGNYTALLASGAVTLNGGGTVVLGGGDSRIQGPGTLTNTDNLITGGGLIGDDGAFTFINQGVVDGTGGIILGSGAAAVVNTGSLQSTSGSLLIRGTTVANSGTIQALAGGAVTLQSATIVGGRLHTAGGGTITEVDRGSVLDGVTLGAGDSVSINNNQALTLQHVISNAGTITASSQGNYTALLASGAVTLTGGGAVVLGGGDARLQGGGALTNVNNTISGAGSIGYDGAFSFVNQGTVNATSNAQALILGSGAAIANTGLLESSSAPGLVLNTTLENTGGRILAATSGARVVLQSSAIHGGRIGSVAGGVIEVVDRGTTLDGVSVDAGSQVTIDNNQALTLVNNSNQGTFNLASSGNYTALLASGAVGLSNSKVVLGGGDSRIQGAGTFTNGATSVISGAGTIANDGGFTFINQGLVDANSTAQALAIGPGASISNTGTLKASTAAGLTLFNMTLENTGGLVQAAAGATVRLQSSTLHGGRIGSLGTGMIEVVDRGSTLDTVTIDAGSQVVIDNDQALTLKNSANQGTFNLASAGNYTALLVSGAVGLSNSTVLLGGGDSRIQGGGTLTTAATTVLRGAGSIGVDGTFSLLNQGLIDANSATQALVIGSGQSIVNAGVMQGSGAAGLTFSGMLLENGAGLVQAGPGSVVRLRSSTIHGGHLATGQGGVIEIVDRGSVLDGVTVDAGSQVTIDNNQALTLVNNQNKGNFLLASQGNYTALLSSGAVALTASTVTLGGGDSRLQGAGSLTNGAGSVITGAGSIGADGGFSFANQSLVSATGQLIVGSGAAIGNTGVMQAASGGTLLFQSMALANAGGTVKALAGGSVQLQSATITGGTLGGAVTELDRGSTLDGVTISANGVVGINNNQALTLAHAIVNAGTIGLNSSGNYTALTAAGAVTLSGGGTVTLGAGDARITSAGASTLNNTDNTISGGGSIGDGTLSLTNGGVIDATSTQALRIDTGGNAVVNTGTLRADGPGNLVLASVLSGAGKIELHGAGTVTLAAAVGSQQAASFVAGATGTLVLNDSQEFAGSIAGLAGDASNALDLTDIRFDSASLSYAGTAAGGTLSLTDGTRSAALKLVGDYRAATFKLARDGGGGTLVRDPVAGIDQTTLGADPIAFIAPDASSADSSLPDFAMQPAPVVIVAAPAYAAAEAACPAWCPIEPMPPLPGLPLDLR